MEHLTLQGAVWVFGDNVDTDQISPGQYLDLPVEELSRHVLEALAPDFAQKVQAGDIIVAGASFGCGSSRETAPQALKHLGVAAVIAESFGRIFFRNAIAIGLPVLVCPRITTGVSAGDKMEVDFDAARVTNLVTAQVFEGEPLPDVLLTMLKRGGIMKLLAEG